MTNIKLSLQTDPRDAHRRRGAFPGCEPGSCRLACYAGSSPGKRLSKSRSAGDLSHGREHAGSSATPAGSAPRLRGAGSDCSTRCWEKTAGIALGGRAPRPVEGSRWPADCPRGPGPLLSAPFVTASPRRGPSYGGTWLRGARCFGGGSDKLTCRFSLWPSLCDSR